MVDVSFAVFVVGANVAVAPDGRLLVPKVTAEAKPPAIVSVTPEVTLAPADSETLAGAAASRKV